MGGAIVTEIVFGLRGLGRDVVQAILKKDLPDIIGVTILSAALIVEANVVVDAVQLMLDPSVRSRGI